MQVSAERGLKLVALGGGTGLSTVLSGLKQRVGEQARGGLWLEALSAIVTVSDDGGSSGRLRDELQMLPPGDIRNCMVALSEDSTLLSRLFQYRFRGEGGLGGHSFGNLFLAALTEVTGDFVEAVRLSSEVLASKGRIYPATLNDVRLVAELEDGREVRGETRITASKSQYTAFAFGARAVPSPAGGARGRALCGHHHGRPRLALHLDTAEPARRARGRVHRLFARGQDFHLQSDDAAGRDRRLHGAAAHGGRQDLRARD